MFVCTQIDDYSLVKFYPLDISDEDTMATVQQTVDNAIQWGEDLEVREEKVSVWRVGGRGG